LRRAAGGGARRIFLHGGHKRSVSVRLHRAAGDALTRQRNMDYSHSGMF
jgi:hypothetical protein